MATYKTIGTIVERSEIAKGTSRNGNEWQRMHIILEIPGYKGSTYKQVFQVYNEDVRNVGIYSIGDKVEVTWSMYAREWNGKWYNNVDLVQITLVDSQNGHAPAPVQDPAPAPRQDKNESLEPQADDLPF